MRGLSLLLIAACTACTVVPRPIPVAAVPAPTATAPAPITEAPLAQPTAGQPATAQSATTPPAAPSNCRDYTIPVTIEGKEVQALGHACLQPDGSWQVTQTTPGKPPESYTVQLPAEYAYPYPTYPYYPPYAYDPWYYGPPYFYGGSLFFATRFGHFHHFHHHHGGGHHR
jgi:hypothetical protein